VFVGLEPGDAQVFAGEWRGALADLGSCEVSHRAGWAVAFGESAAGWWPSDSPLAVRGAANAIVRSATVEAFHTSPERVTFLDSNVGTMCLNWCAVSVLRERLRLSRSDDWGLSAGDHRQAASAPLFTAAVEQFPAAAAVIAALGSCELTGRRIQPLSLPAPDGQGAFRWLEANQGATRPASSGGEQRRQVRSAWTAPAVADLEYFRGHEALVLHSLTRLSRHPVHLAATIEWLLSEAMPVATPNVVITADSVLLRRRMVPASALDALLGGDAAAVEQLAPSGGDRFETALRSMIEGAF